MNASSMLKVCGVLLLTVWFVHFYQMPWGLVAGAGVALLTLS